MENKNQSNKVLNNWKLDTLIGQGDYSEVYKISKYEWKRNNVNALKLISLPFTSFFNQVNYTNQEDKDAMKLYFKESAEDIRDTVNKLIKLSSSNSNHFLKYYETQIVEKNESIGYILKIRMEYSISLNQIIKTCKLRLKDILNLGISICNSLNILEKNKILHGNITENNIFFSNGKYKLGDNGFRDCLSDCFKEWQTSLNPKEHLLLKAPEIFSENPVYDNTIDIYSLGLILYKLLNQGILPLIDISNQPIDKFDILNSFEKRIKGEPLNKPIKAENKLGEMILKACSYNKVNRYTKAIEFANDLKRIMSCYSEEELNEIIYCNTDNIITSTKTNKFATNIKNSYQEEIFTNPSTLAEDTKNIEDDRSIKYSNIGNIFSKINFIKVTSKHVNFISKKESQDINFIKNEVDNNKEDIIDSTTSNSNNTNEKVLFSNNFTTNNISQKNSDNIKFNTNFQVNNKAKTISTSQINNNESQKINYNTDNSSKKIENSNSFKVDFISNLFNFISKYKNNTSNEILKDSLNSNINSSPNKPLLNKEEIVNTVIINKKKKPTFEYITILSSLSIFLILTIIILSLIPFNKKIYAKSNITISSNIPSNTIKTTDDNSYSTNVNYEVYIFSSSTPTITATPTITKNKIKIYAQVATTTKPAPTSTISAIPTNTVTPTISKNKNNSLTPIPSNKSISASVTKPTQTVTPTPVKTSAPIQTTKSIFNIFFPFLR